MALIDRLIARAAALRAQASELQAQADDLAEAAAAIADPQPAPAPSPEPEPEPEPVDPTAPHYTDGMQPFEVRFMDGAYAPTDSAPTYRGSQAPPWNSSGGYFGALGQIQAWSGGCFDPTTKRLHFSGGGHSDGNPNGISYFDWTCVNGRPRGFGLLPGSRSELVDIPLNWQSQTAENGGTYPDGRPGATHTYSHMPMSPKRQRIYRGWYRHFCFDIAAGSWRQLTDTQIIGPGGVVLVSPDETQLLAMASSSGALVQFVDADTGARTTAAKSPLAGQSSSDSSVVHDTKRDRYIVIGSKDTTLFNYTLAVDWANKKVTMTTLKNATHAGMLCGAMGMVYDEALDCIWAMGGKDEARKLGKFGRIIRVDAETLDVIAAYPLVDAEGDPVEVPCQCVGQYGRIAWLRGQRAIGLVTGGDIPACVIKLPGAASTAPPPPGGGGEDEPAPPEEPAPAPEPAPVEPPAPPEVVDPAPPASPTLIPQHGVLFEHRFERDAELSAYIRSGTSGNPLTLIDTGNGRAIRAMTYGTSIVEDVPECAARELQWLRVADASHLPPTVPTTLFIGSGSCTEQIELVARDLDGNRVQVRRRMTTQAIKMVQPDSAGVAVVIPEDRAPWLPGDGSYTLGIDTTGMWARPLAAMRCPGLPDDIGISNGAARKPRVWPIGVGNDGPHVEFREGYWGHPSHIAEYDEWLPRDNNGRKRGVRHEAYEGSEFYLAFDVRVSSEKLAEGQPRTKGCFIQHGTGSGSGQAFFQIGPKYKDMRPGPFGNPLLLMTSYADSAAPAGGVLTVPQGDLGKSTSAWQHPDEFPECRYYPTGTRDPICWRWPADRWVREQFRFRPGRDNAPLNPTGQSTSKLAGPWPAETDPAYRTLVGLYVSEVDEQGNTIDGRWITVQEWDQFIWFFGDQKFQAGYYFMNPPSFGSLWLGAPGNIYIGSGSVAPPKAMSWVDYRNVVLSRDPIPLSNGMLPGMR